MKKFFLIFISIFFIGCEDNPTKFKKMEINEDDTKITNEKLKHTLENTGNGYFDLQQGIDREFKEASEQIK